MAQTRKEHPVKQDPTPDYDYIVKSGDSLSNIAVRAYGCDGGPQCWDRIYKDPDNHAKIGDNPNHIEPNLRLYIPPK